MISRVSRTTDGLIVAGQLQRSAAIAGLRGADHAECIYMKPVAAPYQPLYRITSCWAFLHAVMLVFVLKDSSGNNL